MKNLKGSNNKFRLIIFFKVRPNLHFLCVTKSLTLEYEIKFGIVGLGRIGKIHFENINSFI